MALRQRYLISNVSTHPVCTDSAEFNEMRHIIEPLVFLADMVEANCAQTQRKANFQFAEMGSLSRQSAWQQYKAMFAVAAASVNPGHELFVDYGDSYKFDQKRVSAF